MEKANIDRRTWTLAASALFIFGAFFGCAVYRLLGIGESELYDNLIERYFLALFRGCTSPLDVLRTAADCCLHELWAFFAVFAAGYTLYSLPVSGAALFWRGMLFGFSLTMLQFSTRTGLVLYAGAYLFASGAVSFLLIQLCAWAAAFRHGRELSGRMFAAVFFRIAALVCVNVVGMLAVVYVWL